MKTGLQLTIASSPKTPLVKGYRWEGGLLVPTANPGSLSRGTYQVFEATTAHRVYAILHSLMSTNGLILNGPVRNIAGGVPTRRGDIVSRAVAETILDDALRACAITRSGDCYEWSEDSMWAGLDLDKCPEHVRSLPQLQTDLKRVLAEFTCGCLMYTSGSCLLKVRGGDFLRGFKAHVIYPVKDGRNIAALSKAIKIRLEAAGYVVDTTVNTPEHWWFAGAPVLGPGLVGHEREWLVVEGAEYLEEAELLTSAPSEEVALPPRAGRVGAPVTLTESEQRRYVSGFLAHKLRELEAWASVVAGSSSRGRHGELNGRVFACGPYEAAGLVDAGMLWEMVLRGAESNGYGRKVGVARMRAEFEKALDEGGLVDLPPLRAEATAVELFGGAAPVAPCMPVVESVAAVAEALHAGEVMAQWVGSWLGGDRAWPDWALYETEGGRKTVVESALTKGDKALLEREFKAWKKMLKRRALAQGADGIMGEMNDTYAFVKDRGGKTAVMWWNDKDDECFSSVRSLHEIEANRFVMVEDTKVTYSKLWMEHPARRTYESVVFDPANNVSGNHYNLWKGYSVQAQAGDWSLMKAHIYNVMAGGVEEYYKFIIFYFAWCLQNPALAAEVALVFRGAPGCGKGVVLRMMNEIFGKHGLQFADSNLLFGAFSGHLEKCCFLYYDEPHATTDKSSEGKLKNIITEKSIIIHPKNMQPFSAPNRLKIVMSTNSDWAVPVGIQDRRFAVFDATADKVKDKEYFIALNAEVDSGGKEAFLNEMLSMDLADWHPRWHIPDTEAKRQQAELSLSPVDAWWLNILETGELPGLETPATMKFTTLANDLYTQTKYRMRPQTLSTKLQSYGGEIVRTATSNRWQFQTVDKCRALWDVAHGARNWTGRPVWRTELGAEPPLIGTQSNARI